MYKLSETHLRKYAQVLVRFALNGGKGINAGETVYLVGQECSKDLYLQVYGEIIAAGGNVINGFLPDEFDRFGVNLCLAKNGTQEQLSFFPEPYYSGLLQSIDHQLAIIAIPNPHALTGAPGGNATKISSALSPYIKLREQKERKGKFSWALCYYGTPAAAKEAGLSEEEYWEQIIAACHLDEDDPIATWKGIQRDMLAIRNRLDDMRIESLLIESPDARLRVPIGPDRKWLGGTGRNIPSYEVFTTPDWRGVSGWIRINQPLYYLGSRISGIYLRFQNGQVIEAKAKENQEALISMLSQPDANKLGEFSLTDKRFSKITKFMANTLFDENMGGEFGNMHIAVGRCFLEAYAGDDPDMSPERLYDQHGFNRCMSVHVDMISTADRTVTAFLPGGSKEVIYKSGQFTFL